MRKTINTRNESALPPSQFLKAVAEAGINSTYAQVGLKAIKGEDRAAIKPKTTKAARRLTGSLDMDAALRDRFPQDPRWDYGVGLMLTDNKTEVAIWIEVHPATTGEVDCFLKKLNWLKTYLKQYAALSKLTERAERHNVQPFYWIATDSGVHIPAHMPQAKQLAGQGISLPTRTLKLPQC